MKVIANDWINHLSPYEAGKPISELAREFGLQEENIIKLASNENPLGFSELAKQAISSELAEIARYPDGAAFALKQALVEHLSAHQINASQITLGNGSNDILDLIARIFLRPGTNAIFSAHAFIVYKLATITAGAEAREVAAQNYAHDLTAIIKTIDINTKVIFLANPNNPTGTCFTQRELQSFLAQIPAHILVVLDEAYFEYADPKLATNGMQLVHQYPNLVVVRTFSKAYGLAGLRVGYAVAHPEITNLLNKARQPFNVNSLAQIAAVYALKDQDFIKNGITLNHKGMQQIIAGIAKLDLDYLPSQGNFLAIKFAQDTSQINLELLRRGVIVRPIAGYQMPEFLRVSIGTEAENQQFLQTLTAIL